MSKHQHTPASAAVGIEHAIRMLEGRWKLVILFQRNDTVALELPKLLN